MPRYSNFKIKYKKYKNYTSFFILSLMVNRLMLNGKKKKAIRVIKSTFSYIYIKTEGSNPYFILLKSIYNLFPKFKLKAISYDKVLYYFSEKLSDSYLVQNALTLLIKTSRKRKGKNFIEKLANEIIDTFNLTSISLKLKQEKDISDFNKIKTSLEMLEAKEERELGEEEREKAKKNREFLADPYFEFDFNVLNERALKQTMVDLENIEVKRGKEFKKSVNKIKIFKIC